MAARPTPTLTQWWCDVTFPHWPVEPELAARPPYPTSTRRGRRTGPTWTTR